MYGTTVILETEFHENNNVFSNKLLIFLTKNRSYNNFIISR